MKRNFRNKSLRSLALLIKKKHRRRQDTDAKVPGLSENTQTDQKLGLINKHYQKDQFDEYIEFPRLENLKSYRPEDIRPRQNNTPERKKCLEFELCEVKVELKDVQRLESIAMHHEMHPFLLKNAHAVFSGLESCDKLDIFLDELGNTNLLLQKGNKCEEMKLGCIVQYEFIRPGCRTLAVNSRDINGDVAVLGAPCEIQFLELEDEHSHSEAADLLSLYTVDKSHLKKLNLEAGGIASGQSRSTFN